MTLLDTFLIHSFIPFLLRINSSITSSKILDGDDDDEEGNWKSNTKSSLHSNQRLLFVLHLQVSFMGCIKVRGKEFP